MDVTPLPPSRRPGGSPRAPCPPRAVLVQSSVRSLHHTRILIPSGPSRTEKSCAPVVASLDSVCEGRFALNVLHIGGGQQKGEMVSGVQLVGGAGAMAKDNGIKSNGPPLQRAPHSTRHRCGGRQKGRRRRGVEIGDVEKHYSADSHRPMLYVVY